MKLLLLTLVVSFSFINASYSQENALASSLARGEEIYVDFCVTCHLPNGKGVAEIYPPLAQSDYLIKNRKASIKAIKYGLSGDIIVNGKPYNGTMAPLGLSDDEVADVMNYITNSWGNKNTKMITENEVSEIEK
ncbi:c-type cytochrome [Mariniflexile ostreae]|uniref:C-type cytochrome n=1 Tax=Mariniflexile ostreae TaxID=1520892 RepID=A0ABV5F8P1_9FLAO